MNILASSSPDGASNSIKAGDCVIVYEGPAAMKAVYVTAKGRFENRFGVFLHSTWIGKPFGTKVTASLGGRGWVYLLRPTPELWTQVLRHRTQILYLADISMAVTHLGLRPGSVVLESGTGSGSLTHSLARAVAPHGHVHTFEFHAGRAADAASEFATHGLSELVTVAQRNIEEAGFPAELHGAADAVFLDLPGPWRAVPSAAACLKPNGRFCGFSPCIEQVQRTAEALSTAGFTDLITYECLLREYEVHRDVMALGVQLAGPPPPKRRRPNPNAAAAPAGAAGAGEPQQAREEARAEAAAGKEEAAESAGQGEGVTAATAAAAGAEAPESGVVVVGQEGAPQAPTEMVGAGQEGGGSGVADGSGGAGTKEVLGGGGADDGAAAGGSVRSPAIPLLRMVTCRPALEARGHTGYLLFARKFVAG